VRQLAEMDITKDYGGITMQKLSEPALGELVKPKLAIVLAVAGVFGLFAGVGLCYVIELADRSFRSPEDVRRQLGVPIVGHIPVIPFHRIHAKKKGQAPASPLHPVICTYHQPRGRQSEAYRAVRTSLYFGTQGETHKVIQITSPNPGDGKTTLAANLAVSIADSGKRVLLVDADFRRPKIHKYFGLDNAAGVSSVVAGETEIVDAILPTTVKNLSAMPCGPRPHNPADLLTSPRFKEMIDLVREQYDFVIVDTPPLLAVTDPSVVAPRVDGVLMVLRLTKHARDSAMRANEVLNALGVHTLGVVVNGIGKGAGYGYGSYRYGGYRYGKYRKGYGYGYGYGYSSGYGYGYGSEPAAGNGTDPYYADEKAEKSEKGVSGKTRDRVSGQTKADQ
jgi:capsular exopolysaccharide synthesis family protein